MTHDDLVAVLLLLGVSPVDVAAEGGLNASSVFMVLLEEGTSVEIHRNHMTGFCLEPLSQHNAIHDAAMRYRERVKSCIPK